MSEARLVEAGPGRWRIEGELDFATVERLWPRMRELLAAGDLDLDLSAVRAANSAGLALLLEAKEAAQRAGHRLRLEQVPGSLRSMAALSNATGLLGIGAG